MKPALLALALFVSVLGLNAQEVGRLPAFEVASVKPNNAGPRGSLIDSRPGRFIATNVPLTRVIRAAYQIAQFPPVEPELLGGPSWIRSDRFDIEATVPDGAPLHQMPIMLRALLAERFRLVAHFETREMPVYALVLARRDGKFGPKLVRSTVDCQPILAARKSVRPTASEPPVCASGMMSIRGSGAAMTYRAGNGTMLSLASLLLSYTGRPVLDRTGLVGEFNFNLAFAPDNGNGLSVTVNDVPREPGIRLGDGPSVFQAVEEQLGLKLESTRGPVEFLVIDSVERPTPD